MIDDIADNEWAASEGRRLKSALRPFNDNDAAVDVYEDLPKSGNMNSFIVHLDTRQCRSFQHQQQ